MPSKKSPLDKVYLEMHSKEFKLSLKYLNQLEFRYFYHL